MAHSEAVKQAVRQLFIFEGSSLERAAEKAGVSYATARRWKRQAVADGDDWEKIRAAHTLAGGDLEDVARQLLTDLVIQFKSTMDALKTADDIDAISRVQLLTSLSDSYNKAIGANKKLLPQASQLAIALDVLQRFANYLTQNKPELVNSYLEVIEPFGKELERDLQ